MKALTLKHPWPFAICRLGKRVENRTWHPPSSLIGQRFAIHGGNIPTGKALDEAWNLAHDLGRIHKQPLDVDSAFDCVFSFAGIVATAVLDSVVTQSDDPWFDGSGFGWVLRDVIVLPEPIVCKGKQGLWTVPDEIVKQLEGSEAPT